MVFERAYQISVKYSPTLVPPLIKIFDSKLSLDKELGCTWHVIVGQDFSADILYEVSRADTWLLIRFRRLSCSGRIYAVCDVRINGITPVEMWISAPKWGKIQSKFSKNFTFPILSKNHNLINNQKAFCWWYTYNIMFPLELNLIN